MLATLVIVFILSEIGAAMLGAYFLWYHRRNQVAKWLGILLTCILVDSLCQLFAYQVRPRGVRPEEAYVWWIATGRVIKSVGIWCLDLYLFRSHRSEAIPE